MCECLAYDDGTQYTCEACVSMNEYAHQRVKKLEGDLRRIEDLIRVPGDPALVLAAVRSTVACALAGEVLP